MKFKYFFVSTAGSDGKPLCIVETKDQAQEYISMKLYHKHLDDFKSWCYFNQRALDNDSWKTYLSTRVDKEELNAFLIGTKSFSKAEIASILRMFTGCAPLGCSFEGQAEYNYFGEKLLAKKKLAENIAKMTAEQLNDITNKLTDAAEGLPDEDELIDTNEVQ